jgi:glycine cleavage system H protein
MKEEIRTEMAYPATYRYTKEHEWIEAGGKIGKVGITDYAQNTLGDIVFVDLPKVGSSLERGKVFGSVESVKAVSDLYSPVTGTVTEVNEELATAPEKINSDAHGAWLLKVELADEKELSSLLNAVDYEKFVKEETH